MENDKHLKGYMFDSLVYRFKDYRYKAFDYEVALYKAQKNLSRVEAEIAITRRHERDLMRFVEILDEAIGEHD